MWQEHAWQWIPGSRAHQATHFQFGSGISLGDRLLLVYSLSISETRAAYILAEKPKPKPKPFLIHASTCFCTTIHTRKLEHSRMANPPH